MKRIDTLAALITTHSRAAIALMLVATLVMGAGATQVDQSPGLDQFEFETEEGDALEFIQEHFEVDDNETAVQIIIKDQDNALSRDSFIQTLELQQAIRDDPEINRTLTEDPFTDLASIVATEMMRAEMIADVEQQSAELAAQQETLETTATELSDGLNETIALQTRYEELNASYTAGEISEDEYHAQSDEIEADLEAIITEVAPRLDDEQLAQYEAIQQDVRSLQAERVQAEIAYEAGDISEEERDDTIATVSPQIEAQFDEIQSTILAEDFADLEAQGEQLEEDQQAIATLDPSIEEQRDYLESQSDDDVEDFVGDLLAPGADRGLLSFLPIDFETGSTQTDARTLFVSQTTDEEQLIEGDAPPRIVDSQLAIDRVVTEHFGDGAFTFGVGVITDEIDRSMADSFAIVLPLALLFVVVVLSIAYRDPLDIILGVAGIGLVLVWTFGFMGWTGIVFNQIMIAVPVLLVGLSIDYAIHVFMRHRERRGEGDPGTREAMRIVLLGLGAALVWVTITAVIGFLSNMVSPVAPIREFGIVSAAGIIATLLIFGILIPATKITLDSFLESRGWNRTKRAFGTGGGRLTTVLNTGNHLAARAPIAVLLIVLLLTGAGAYGATQVDTEFRQEDFIADAPPEWMDRLPAAIAPGEYSVKANLDFVNERFMRQDAQTQILIQGDITRDDTLERIDAAHTAAAQDDVIIVFSDDEADVQSPLRAMQSLAEEDPDFNETFSAADTTGDDIPDSNLSAVYDAFFDADEAQAERFLYRTDDGEYEAARMTLAIRGGATAGEATTATRTIAAGIASDDLSAIATGQLIVFHIIEDQLFETVLESLVITMIAVFAFLMVAYRLIHGSALLGAVTLTPIVLAVAWILGSMHVLDIPFNVITGTITSLTIGLGVAYNIHISERYRLELANGHGVREAMERAVTGTGGALLGSAATTMGGFGVLILAILPPLQQFGFITALTIFYAFLGSVLVLPSLLELWTKYIGSVPTTAETTESDLSADAFD